jgi:glycosyltransferase involved in cell wall biosynthesis
MNVLISAYAVSPNHGSELGMGWNWIAQIAKYCNVFVITEAEFKIDIEEAVKGLSYKDNLVFYFNDIGEKARKMCWNQGDWRFYYYYKKWQKVTYRIANQIIKLNKIDVIHQLNMIGYREPGYLWKIKHTPTIWGPVGGFTTIPASFFSEFDTKNKIGWSVKNILNTTQGVLSFRVCKAINNFSLIVSATPVDLKKLTNLSSNRKNIIHIPETGSYDNDINVSQKGGKKLRILWIGKLEERKALPLALKSLSKLETKERIEFHILGDGKKCKSYKQLSKKLNICDICHWHGNISKKEVQEHLLNTDLLFFTSLQDATSSVVLEALSFGVPVLCHDANGFGAIIDETCGFKIPFISPEISINHFYDILHSINVTPEQLNELSIGAIKQSKKHSWNEHAKQMIELYDQLIKNN